MKKTQNILKQCSKLYTVVYYFIQLDFVFNPSSIAAACVF